jgi:hypothetical protein
MKIGVLGNCQSNGLAESLRALRPDAEVIRFRTAVAMKAGSQGDDPQQRIADHLARCNLVLLQVPERISEGPLSVVAMQSRVRTLVYPHIVFRGFHPDSVLINGPSGRIKGPLGSEVHSAIAVAGFKAGLPASRTAKLFNAYVFAALGYANSFDMAKRRLLNRLASHGYDLLSVVESGQVFMHSGNHPAAFLLHEMARQALGLAGLTAVRAAVPHDVLGDRIAWPVLPALARLIGCQGTETFKTEDGIAIALSEFVEASYRI